MQETLISRLQKARAKYKKHGFIALALVVLVALFGSTIKPLLFVSALIVAASFSTFYHNYFRSPINFELIKMSAILTSVAYGSIAGIIVGVASVIISRAMSGRLDQDTLTSIGALSIVCIVAGWLGSANITLLGISLVVLYFALISPFLFVFGKNFATAGIYIGTNIFFNILLFIHVAPTLLSIMK